MPRNNKKTEKPDRKHKPKGGVPAVGSRVKLLWGEHPVEAEVIEDRGNLGVGGRRLLRIRLALNPGDVAEPVEFEMPAEDVVPVK